MFLSKRKIIWNENQSQLLLGMWGMLNSGLSKGFGTVHVQKILFYTTKNPVEFLSFGNRKFIGWILQYPKFIEFKY